MLVSKKILDAGGKSLKLSSVSPLMSFAGNELGMSAESTSSSTPASQSEAQQPIQSDRQDSVLSRGKLLLSLLSQKAAAARAEAQIAELRLLLIEAQAGNAQRLNRWLDLHTADAEPLQGLSPGEREAAMLDPAGPGLAGADVYPITSWNDLLPGARNRLQLRAELLKSGKSVDDASLWRGAQAKSLRMDQQHANAEPDKAASKSSDRKPHPTKQAALKVFENKGPFSRQPSEQPTLLRSAKGDTMQPLEAKELQRLKALALSFDSEELHEKEEQQNRQRVVSRLGGLVASIVAHVLLLVFLAFFTLRLPTPPASLAFEASSSEMATETLEISEPLNVSSPESQEVSPATESVDVTESLADVTSTMSSALGDFASASPKSRPSAATAAVMAASSFGPSNTNSSFFGAAASGNCFCYIIDGSGSMRNGPWEAAKLELLKSLASLTLKQRFYIIFFNQELSAIPLPGERVPAPRALYATNENLEHARRWVDTLRIDIGAPPNEALKLGIEKEPDAIYLLTDGVTKVDVPKFLREENRIDDLVFGEQVRVPIHTIAFYSLEGQEMLKQIASENKGQFIYVPDPRKR